MRVNSILQKNSVMNYITSSDIQFGDIVINSCDPALPMGMRRDVAEIIYSLAAYALFANRIIIPSRYLLYGGPVYDAVCVLGRLLEEGIIVPDIRENHSSFSEFANNTIDASPEVRARALFLDQHSSTVYSFEMGDQSRRYHTHLLRDINPEQNGALARIVSDQGANHDDLLLIAEKFCVQEGSRSGFIKTASEILPEFYDTFSNWAALRYYTTPTETENRSIRDLPACISNMIRQAGFSTPIFHPEHSSSESMLPPANLAYRVLIDLPRKVAIDNLSVLSDVVIQVRRQVPNGPAKFSSLAEKGFKENAEEINQVYLEAIAGERQLEQLIGSNKVHSFINKTAGFFINFSLLAASGLDTASNVAVSATLDVALDTIISKGSAAIRGKAVPFIETSQRFEDAVRRANI